MSDFAFQLKKAALLHPCGKPNHTIICGKHKHKCDMSGDQWRLRWKQQVAQDTSWTCTGNASLSKGERSVLVQQARTRQNTDLRATERIMVLTLCKMESQRISILQDPKHNLTLGFDQRASNPHLLMLPTVVPWYSWYLGDLPVS